MMQTLYLSFTLPDGEHKKIELKPDPADSVLIGRNRASHIKLNLPSVSRQHAKIFYESGNYWIEDLGSSNGTFVNREQVHHVRISAGNLIQCGEFEIEVLSHAETSVYGLKEEIEELEDVEVIVDSPRPPTLPSALEPRPRPQAPRLSVPPPRASSPFTATNGTVSSRPTVHSKAPTNQPQDRTSSPLSTRASVQKKSTTVVDSGAPIPEPPSSSEHMNQLEQKLQSQAEELSNTQAQADAQRALADKLKAEIQELSSEHQQTQVTLKAIEEERNLLQAELEKLKNERSTAVQNVDSELTQLKTELSATVQGRDELKEQLKTLGSELRRTQRELESLQNEAPTLEELNELKAENKKLRTEKKHLQNELQSQQQNSQEEQDQLKEQLKRHENELRMLKTAEEQWVQKEHHLTTSIAELKTQLTEQKQALKTASVSTQSVSSVTPADWAAHLARFEQLEHELKALRRAVKGQAIGGVRPNTRPPMPRTHEQSQERTSIPPRDQPREWRGLV